jgi:predicted transcriptional regulator
MSEDILALTAQIVSSHLTKNAVPIEELPGLIREIFKSLSSVGEPSAPVERLTPAVPVTKSVFPDYIICLEDGKKLKMLKRHLMNAYNLTADQYRAKWGLPPHYPMVAPNYARSRSLLAKQMGLGRNPPAAVKERNDRSANRRDERTSRSKSRGGSGNARTP